MICYNFTPDPTRLPTRLSCWLVTAALLVLVGSSDAFTPATGVVYRMEYKSSGYMVWQPSQSAGSRLQSQLFRGDGTESWLFVPTNGCYKIQCQNVNLVIGCNSGDAQVYLQAPSSSDGQLWSFVDEGGGYVAVANKLNTNVLTAVNSFGGQGEYISTAANSHYDWQRFWIEELRINPVQTIAVPAGFDTAQPKRIILCANSNLGASVTGTLSRSGSSIAIPFAFSQNRWAQYYYSYTDTNFARTSGLYTVSAPGFPTNTFVVGDDFYRSTPNSLGGRYGIADIMNGFFAYQRESDAANGWTNYLYLPGPTGTTGQVRTNLGVTAHDVHGGWRDATSLDKETYQEACAVRNLAYASEDAVNGVDRTNLLVETEYGASYLLRLQNADGSFPLSVNPPEMAIYVNQDCGTSARSVMALAAAARVLRGYNTSLSTQCLAAATNGWKWVKNNTTNYVTNHTVYPSWWQSSADSVLGAAVELAITTTNPTYQADAKTLFYEGQFDGTVSYWDGVGTWVKKSGSYIRQVRGYDAAIALSRYYRTPQVSGTLKADIAAQLNTCFLAMTADIDTPFGIDSKCFFTFFGQCPVIGEKAYVCLNLAMALGTPESLTVARDWMNWNYGFNPFNSSFICGFGLLNITPQFGRPRTGSIGELIPGILVNKKKNLLCTWNGIATDYGCGEGDVSTTSAMPGYMMLMDRRVMTYSVEMPPGELDGNGNGRQAIFDDDRDRE